MFSLSQLNTMSDPVRHKDGFQSRSRLNRFCGFGRFQRHKVTGKIMTQLAHASCFMRSSHICLSIFSNCLFIYFSVEHYTVLYLII